MLKKVHIKNFKSIKEYTFNLSNLNVLTGLNGSGKSTFIQSLLVLRQSVLRTGKNNGSIYLNGDLTQIGKGKDALYCYAGKDESISFSINFDETMKGIPWSDSISWNNLFSLPNKDILQPYFAMLKDKQLDVIENLSLFSENFQYINTEHHIPKDVYEKSSSHIENKQVGIRGEYAVNLLEEIGNDYVIPFKKLLHPKEKTDNLIKQTEAWLSEISPNIHLNITPIPNSDNLVLGYQYETKDDITQTFKHANVGFGINYVLPIIVAILTADKDRLIILENPEAHLHPRGQSRIGKLLALAAESGIQIIVETHSDHILNGIRVATKKGLIAPENTSIFYFDKVLENREHRARIVEPKIDENGRLSEWPEGFFDEWDNMLDELLME